eukprot:TRINITY_DN6781_c0_g1_i1.p1 TRINITY_DN6781_c0_g1~~TRINITY_DN6781_c0_g1_i1.p1  ORF type:complete len:223 (+),score=36.22 TRINITY_DN6781_c0_g1_i1:369-1037(+)
MHPYSRHFTLRPPTGDLIDMLTLSQDNTVQVSKENQAIADTLAGVVGEYREAQEKKLLLRVPFNSVQDYLYLLKYISCELQRCGASALIFAAAAVSDFYIPYEQMAEHKIQSGDSDCLVLHLSNVPKALGYLVSEWSPKAFVVTFKLETDQDILEFKARKSLASYKQNMVLANLLHNYRDKVVVYSKDGSKSIVERGSERDIEPVLIKTVVDHHTAFINAAT